MMSFIILLYFHHLLQYEFKIKSFRSKFSDKEEYSINVYILVIYVTQKANFKSFLKNIHKCNQSNLWRHYNWRIINHHKILYITVLQIIFKVNNDKNIGFIKIYDLKDI